jgi:hypothetical protein
MAEVVEGSLLSGIRGTIHGITVNKNGRASKKTSSKGSSATMVVQQNAQFGSNASVAKRLRDALPSTFLSGKNKDSVWRLTQMIAEVIKLDETSARGERNVLDGELSIMEGYEVNAMSAMTTVFSDLISGEIVRTSGVCTATIPAHVPSIKVSAPAGTTHYQFTAEAAALNFETGETDNGKKVGAFHVWNGLEVAAESLSINLSDNNTDPIFLTVAVDFYQEMNGRKYLLENKMFNTAQILKVDTGV